MDFNTRLIGALAASALALATVLPGQGYGTPEELIAKRDKKLEADFLKNGDWITDYDRALATAKDQDKLIFAYFTRSYEPSPPCDELESGPLSEAAFASIGDDAVLFVHVTSFVAGERHGNLLVEKGGQAFPSVMILDENGDVLTRRPKDEHTVDEFRKTLRTASTWKELKAKATAGDNEVADEIFLAEIRLGMLDYETARRRHLRFPDFTDEEHREILGLLSNLEMDWALATLGREDPALIDKRFVQMKAAGRIPSGESARVFWLRLLEYARTETNADLFEDALGGMRKLLGDDKRYESWFVDMEEILRELRG